MKLITRDVDYAIRILMYMAKNSKKKLFEAGEFTKNLKIPKFFTRKIMRILSANKLIQSRKGKDGGFIYAPSIRKISVAQIITAFHGKTEINKCLFKKRICPNREKCPLRGEIVKIEKMVNRKLGNLTINKIIKSSKEAAL